MDQDPFESVPCFSQSLATSICFYSLSLRPLFVNRQQQLNDDREWMAKTKQKQLGLDSILAQGNKQDDLVPVWRWWMCLNWNVVGKTIKLILHVLKITYNFVFFFFFFHYFVFSLITLLVIIIVTSVLPVCVILKLIACFFLSFFLFLTTTTKNLLVVMFNDCRVTDVKKQK